MFLAGLPPPTMATKGETLDLPRPRDPSAHPSMAASASSGSRSTAPSSSASVQAVSVVLGTTSVLAASGWEEVDEILATIRHDITAVETNLEESKAISCHGVEVWCN